MALALNESTASNFIDILQLANVSSLAVPSQTAVRTYSFPFFENRSFGWEVQFSGTTINVKIQLEQAVQGRPSSEGGGADVDYVIPDEDINIADGITDNTVHLIKFAPGVFPFGRLLLTGLSGNTSDVLLTRCRLVTVVD